MWRRSQTQRPRLSRYVLMTHLRNIYSINRTLSAACAAENKKWRHSTLMPRATTGLQSAPVLVAKSLTTERSAVLKLPAVIDRAMRAGRYCRCVVAQANIGAAMRSRKVEYPSREPPPECPRVLLTTVDSNHLGFRLYQ